MRSPSRASTRQGERRPPAASRRHHPPARVEPSVLARFRSLCRGLPGSVETLTFGHPTFQAGPRHTFAVLDDHERPGLLCLVVKLDPALQAAVVDGDTCFPSKFGARHGWTAVRIDAATDWRRAGELVVMSFRRVAPARLVARIDARVRPS